MRDPRPDGNGNATILTSPVQHSYAISPNGTLSTSATGAHIDADFVEVLPSGAAGTPHTIHLAGDIICGTILTS